MGEVDDAALADHQVEVELLAQTLVEVQGFVVDGGAFVPEVVGADDGRVAAGIAATDPALFQDRDVGNTVFLG